MNDLGLRSNLKQNQLEPQLPQKSHHYRYFGSKTVDFRVLGCYNKSEYQAWFKASKNLLKNYKKGKVPRIFK
jgi:hypothetical protein